MLISNKQGSFVTGVLSTASAMMHFADIHQKYLSIISKSKLNFNLTANIQHKSYDV